VGSGPQWLDILVNTPALFEISTFSTLIRAFAESYHLVLNTGSAHRCVLRVVTAFLIIVNIAAYSLLILAYVYFAETGDHSSSSKIYKIAVGSVFGASAVLGVCFLCYGSFIIKIHNRLIRSIHGSSLYESSGTTEEITERTSPLARMTSIAIVCAICFISRSLLLLASILFAFDVQGRVSTSAVYFVLCEIVPAILMIYLFRKGRLEQTQFNGKKGQRGISSRHSEDPSPYSPLSPEVGKWRDCGFNGPLSHSGIIREEKEEESDEGSGMYQDNNLEEHLLTLPPELISGGNTSRGVSASSDGILGNGKRDVKARRRFGVHNHVAVNSDDLNGECEDRKESFTPPLLDDEEEEG